MSRRIVITLGLIAACAGGCSREGGGPPAGNTPDLRLLPLVEEPVEICDAAGRRVGATQSRGFCVDAVAPVGCASCTARQVCSCGRCVFRSCASNLDCPTGQRCRNGRCDTACDGDADCPGGRCADGVCLSSCGAGCSPGERCDSDVCRPHPCQRDADCGSGRVCDLALLRLRLVEPAVVRTSAGLEMAVEERRSAGSRILLATSSDGRHWVLADAPALEAAHAWEEGSVGSPALVSAAGSLTLYYEGGDGAGIGRARLEGGRFVSAASPVLAPSEPWEEGHVGAPTTHGGGDAIYYEAGRVQVTGGGPCAVDEDCTGALLRCLSGSCRPRAARIGRAFVDSGGPRHLVLDAAQVEAGAAVRDEGVRLWESLAAVHSPGVLSVTSSAGEPLTLLYFSAVGVERPGARANRSVGVASSRDGVLFVSYAYNPILARLQLFTEPLAEGGASPLLVDGVLHLYFDGAGEGASTLPGLALGPP